MRNSHILKDLVDFEGIEIYWPDAQRMLTAEGYRRFKDARIILLVAVLFGLAVVLCRGLIVPGLSPAETRYLRGVWAIASLVLMEWGAFSAKDWLSMRGGLVSSMVVITLVCCGVAVMIYL